MSDDEPWLRTHWLVAAFDDAAGEVAEIWADDRETAFEVADHLMGDGVCVVLLSPPDRELTRMQSVAPSVAPLARRVIGRRPRHP